MSAETFTLEGAVPITIGGSATCEVCRKSSTGDHPCRFERCCSCWRGIPCGLPCVPFSCVLGRASLAGSHFFDRDTMRFFHSRLPRSAYIGPDDAYWFVTSESYGPEHPRHYTIRRQGTDGYIDTVGDFLRYSSRRTAERAMLGMLS